MGLYDLASGESKHFSDALYTYLQSRMFYVRWYEHFCSQSPEFRQLQDLLKTGYKLQIVGYDAFGVPINAQTMEAAFKDASRPFGHEAVLCCLLLGLKPWQRDARLGIYGGMFPDFLREVPDARG